MSRIDGKTSEAIASFLYEETLTVGEKTAIKILVDLNNVENTKLSTWGGSANLTTTGTITSGTWQGTAIADAYIASATDWNNKGEAGQVEAHIGPLTGIGTTWNVSVAHSGSTTMTASAKTITLSNLSDGYEASLTVIGAATTGALTLAHAGLTVKGTIDTTSLTTGDECIIGIKRSGSSMLINQSPTMS